MRPTKQARLPQLRVDEELKRRVEALARKEQVAVADLQREGLRLVLEDRRHKKWLAGRAGTMMRAAGDTNADEIRARLLGKVDEVLGGGAEKLGVDHG